MTNHLTELYVGQEEADGSGSMGGSLYNNDHTKLHTKPLHLAFHSDKLYLFFSFKKNKQEVLDTLLKQITISDEIKYEISNTNTNVYNEVRYMMRIGQFDQEMTLKFGNTPEIHIFKTKPMQISLLDTAINAPIVLFHSGMPMGLRLLASKDQNPTFVFSEPIDRELSIIEPDIGRWKDDTHYQIKLSAKPFTDSPRIIFNVKSVRGNKLNEMDSYVTFKFTNNRQWFEEPTKAELTGETRLQLYDNLIFSPDRSSYVGNVFLEGSFGDEGGGHYGLVFEQSNKPAVILETDYHINDADQKFELFWLDNQRFIYKSYVGIQLYDLQSRKKTNIVAQPDDNKNYINAFTYDINQSQLHVMWVKYGENELPAVFRYNLYDGSFKQPKAEKVYTSESKEEYIYHTLPLMMYPSKQGMFWTKVVNSRIQTEYIGNDGSKSQARGKIVGMSMDAVYLLDEPIYGTNGYGEPKNRKFYYWKVGTAPKAVNMPLNLGFLKAFGNTVSAQSFDNNELNYRYDINSNEWRPFNKENVKITMPYQLGTAFYRIN
jgi:hypothetical protein